jgi:hypothetical protein
MQPPFSYFHSILQVTTIVHYDLLISYHSRSTGTMPTSFADLQFAFEFVNASGMSENQAFLDRQSGKIYWHSEVAGAVEELPEDIDDEKYIEMPHRKELNLGKPLALDFVDQFLFDDHDEVRRIFGRRGAYGRFKALLARRGALDRWYDFSARAEEAALRNWCAENAVELSD